MVVSEEATLDVLDIALKERESLNRLATLPDLLSELSKIKGIEFADSKGVAIVSLSEAGPTIGTITSPSGRLKARLIVSDHKEKELIHDLFSKALAALDDLPPLSPITLVLVLKLIEDSLVHNSIPELSLITNVARCNTLAPMIILKRNVFEVMCEHVLADDTGAKEIASISAELDGRSSLLNLIRKVEANGGSLFRLLIGLDELHKNEALKYTSSDDLSKVML